MRNFSLQRTLVLPLAIGLLFTGCKRYSSDFGDTNLNPAATTSPILSALLTNVEAGLGSYSASVTGGLFCQYFSETQYSSSSLYATPQSSFEGEYSGALYDLQNIINTNTSNNMTQVARILKAYIFVAIADRWGDAPYSQALTGTNRTPSFDSQENIYRGCMKELTEAVAAMDGSSAVLGDIIYSGNISKWKKMANTLRLRLAIQVSKRYPLATAWAATEFKAALANAAGVITSNDDNFKITYPGSSYKSPWYNLYDGRKDYGESNTMTGLMSSLSDGRQAAFGTSTLGVPYGWKRETVDPWCSANTNWSRVLNDNYRLETGSVQMITAAEAYLHRAEAADRGWTAEDLNTMYQNGINASFTQWNLAAPASSYFSQTGVILSSAAGANANISKIALQQYIAAYPDGLRGWNIWRRTGYPALTPALDAVNSSKQIPRRYTYGTSSYATNSAAVTAAATAIGGDTQDTRTWWDKD